MFHVKTKFVRDFFFKPRKKERGEGVLRREKEEEKKKRVKPAYSPRLKSKDDLSV